VYTETVNFPAIKTALVAREKMQKRRSVATLEPTGPAIDVKLDHGGIRDIEFLVQCLQRVYGGAEPWLRSGGTLFSLHKLHDKGHISGREFHDLTSAYEFLRHLEHRLQLREGQQTHRLPAGEAELHVLQRAMEGYAPGEYRAGDLTSIVGRRMAAVAEIYQRIIYQQQTRGRQQSPGTDFKLLSALEPATADHSSQQILERLAADSPELYQAIKRQDLGPQARKSVFRFLSSAFSSSQRYAAVLQHPGALLRALVVFDTSEYLTEILIRHPEEIITLAELEPGRPRTGGGYLFEPGRELFGGTADPVFAYLADSSVPYGEKRALLRQHFRHRAFVAGARDILEARDVYESFCEIAVAAEEAIATAYAMAGSPAGLAVMALGRLGSGEFDLLSDADLLFVCGEENDRLALTRCAEQMMHSLAAYTREGMVFPVDARLRPRGSEGELLITPTQLAAYFEQEAQAWEALMYTKLRFVAGSRDEGQRAQSRLEVLFERFAREAGFLRAVREMRVKLEAAEAPESSFKSSPGGTYDIDFATSFLLVKHGVPEKPGSLRDRLWRCAAAGLLQKADAAVLDHAAELLRTVEHVSRLAVGRAIKWLPATEHGRQVTEKLTGQILQREFPDGLERELEKTCRDVRQIYEGVLEVE
jgi:glutamate-ammonia-ligase adenylyltransferase